MPSTDLIEFIRSVPIAIHITIDLNGPKGNETERNEPDSYTEMDNRTTETDLNGPTYAAEGEGRAGQDGVWQDRIKVGVGVGWDRVW